MVKLPETNQEWLDYLEFVFNQFSQYENIKKKNAYLLGFKNKDPKKFKRFKELVNDLVIGAAFISNNKSRINGAIEHGAPEKKQRDLILSLSILIKLLPEISKLQIKLAEI